MKLLVTGSEGFIGSHLLASLAGTDHEILTVDRRPGADHQIALSRDFGLGHLLDTFQPDRVIHLAATYGIRYCSERSQDAIENNALMTATIAKECGDRGIKLVYTSTSEVYGADGAWTEDDMLPPARNVYGMSKRWGEDVCHLHSHDPIILRLTMPYGPGVPPGPYRHALGNFLWQAHHRMPIIVHRGAIRSWCWIDDLIAGMMLVIEQATGGTWNIGRDDDPVTMVNLARRCCQLTGASESLIRVVDPPPERTMRKRLITTKLQTLGWQPQMDLHEGLALTLEWERRFDRDGNYLEAVA